MFVVSLVLAVVAVLVLFLAFVLAIVAVLLPPDFPLHATAFPGGRGPLTSRGGLPGNTQGIGQSQWIGELGQEQGTTEHQCDKCASQSGHGVLQWQVLQSAGFLPN